jgi:hypothetical protein
VAHYKGEDDVNLVFWLVLCKPPETNGLCLRLSSSALYFLHYTTAVNLLLFFRFFLTRFGLLHLFIFLGLVVI